MTLKSILILSGGLDSTVSSYLAREVTSPQLALTFHYGQRAALREINAAQGTAGQLGVPHRVIQLPWLQEITKTSLVNLKEALPRLKTTSLDDQEQGLTSAKAVWVPNRNGIFLNIAAAFAETLDAKLLVTGFNKEEAATFPDNSSQFVAAAREFFRYSTWGGVEVASYTQDMSKVEIAKKGKELKIPFEGLWFCYEGGEFSCGRCESCLRARRAFRQADVSYAWRSDENLVD